jgi:hypothetical protein
VHPPRRIGDGDIVRAGELRIRLAFAANLRSEIHVATQHSPLERTFFLTSLSASHLGDLTPAFFHRNCWRPERNRSTDDDGAFVVPE